MKFQFMKSALLLTPLFMLAATSQASHSWGTYHWARTANPFTLQVIDSVTSDWNNEFNDTLAQWSVSEVLDLTVINYDDGKKTRRTCKMVTGQLRVCNENYGFNGWLGLATIGIDSNGHIDRGTAQVNDSYSSYWTIEGEKNHVMCQEVGHLFGLGHTSEDGSSQQTCMDYSSDPASQWPNAHDFDMLASIYSNLDSYNSYDNGTSSGGGGCSSPPGKGCNRNGVDPGNPMLNGIPPTAIRLAGNAFEETWAAPRGDGGFWLYHVRLAP